MKYPSRNENLFEQLHSKFEQDRINAKHELDAHGLLDNRWWYQYNKQQENMWKGYEHWSQIL